MNFREIRVKAGKSVKEVTEYMGVSNVAVYYWESGRTVPNARNLLKLAKFYNCAAEELLEGGDINAEGNMVHSGEGRRAQTGTDQAELPPEPAG